MLTKKLAKRDKEDFKIDYVTYLPSFVLILYYSQIKFVILLSVNPTFLYNGSSENLVLDQLFVLKRIFFFILISYLVDIV